MGSRMTAVVGHSAAPLDGRFTSVRTSETNLGNLVADVFCHDCRADCALLNSGTFRCAAAALGVSRPPRRLRAAQPRDAQVSCCCPGGVAAAAPAARCSLQGRPGVLLLPGGCHGRRDGCALLNPGTPRCAAALPTLCLGRARRSDMLHEAGPITYQTLMQILPMVSPPASSCAALHACALHAEGAPCGISRSAGSALT